MVLKLYGTNFATCTRRVGTVLYQKKIPFEFVTVDIFKGDQKSPEHIKRQPFGRIPCLEDDGFMLFESRAIMRYLDMKYSDKGPKLIPTDLRENAIFEQAASVELNHFDPYASKAAAAVVYKRFRGEEPDWEVYKENVEKLEKEMDGYEALLAKQKYIGGDEITLADMFHLPYGSLLTMAGCNLLQDPEKRPNVARWWNEITQLEGWLAVKDGVASLPA